MNAKGRLMLRVLINRYHKGSSETLLKGLPEGDAKAISDLKTNAKTIDPAVHTPKQQLQKIHYSWLFPLFNELPEPQRPYFLAALPEKQAMGIRQLLKLEIEPLTPTPLAQRFLLSQFLTKFLATEKTPKEFLPDSKFTPLLSLSKHQLVQLIAYLGIRDLGEEMRQIVDKNRLKQIIHLLITREQNYLKKCLASKARMPSLRLGLDKWDGKKETLMRMIQKRGLIRLAQALSGQDPELVDHLCQHLDTGRGKILKKYCLDKEIPTTTARLTTQVTQLIKLMEHKSSS